MAAKKITFDEGMDELQKLVESMEKGNLTLEELFVAHEKGVKLSAKLRGLLDEGEARLLALTASGDEDIASEVEK